jgi:hypothetical protein
MVLETMRILDDDGFQGALGLVDADFDRVQGKTETNPNVIMPNGHDLDTMLVFSPALNRVLIEVGSSDKIGRFGQNVLEALIERALPVAYLRLHSLRTRLGLKFRGLDYSAWIARSTFEPKYDDLITEVPNISQRHDLTPSHLEEAIQELREVEYHVGELCTGTDLIGILSVGLRGVLGSKRASDVTSEKLKSMLRLAFSEDDFTNSGLHEAIRCWEERSPWFRILKNA